METVPETDFALSDILYELAAREPIFHRAEPGTPRSEFALMLAPDFREIGASGRVYDRDTVLDQLEQRYKEMKEKPAPEVFDATDFHCRKLAENVYLLTYSLVQDGKRRTLRSTIWQRSMAGWKVVFHQGTMVDPGF
jgi:hypothetical protein